MKYKGKNKHLKIPKQLTTLNEDKFGESVMCQDKKKKKNGMQEASHL